MRGCSKEKVQRGAVTNGIRVRHGAMCQRGGWAPNGGRHETVCQQGRWALKGGGLGSPTSIGEGNKCQRGRWTLKVGGLWDLTLVGEKNETFFIREWKPLPSRRVLKPWKKAQRGQYLLAVGFGLRRGKLLGD